MSAHNFLFSFLENSNKNLHSFKEHRLAFFAGPETPESRNEEAVDKDIQATEKKLNELKAEKEQIQSKTKIEEKKQEDSVAEGLILTSTKDGLETLSRLGVEIKNADSIKKLTYKEYSYLANVATGLKSLYEQDKGKIENIMIQVEKIQTNLDTVLEKSEIQGVIIKIDENHSLNWERKTEVKAEVKVETEKPAETKTKAPAATATEEPETSKEVLRSQEIERIQQEKFEKRVEVYREKYSKLVEKQYKIHSSLASSDETFKKRWLTTANHKDVQNMMERAPFEFSREEVPQKVHDIVTNNIADLTEDVDFDDIFDMVGGKFQVSDGTGIKFEDADDFIEQLKKLEKKKNPNADDLRKMNVMFGEVVVPSLELLNALSKLKYKPTTADQEVVKEELPEDQKKIAQGLSKLCGYSERKGSAWEETLVWLAPNGKGKMTMADMNGQNFSVDKGVFRRHNSPSEAIKILNNNKNLYTIENGQKVLDKTKITEHVNGLIYLGFLNKFIKEQTGKNADKRSTEEILADPTFTARLEKLYITDITQAAFSTEQMKAFQAGFILDQASTVDVQNIEGLNALTQRPEFQGIVEQLLSNGIPPKQIKAIQSKLLLVGGAIFNTTTGKFEGGGLGTAIDIGNGYNMLVGIGGSVDQGFVAGMGLTLNVYNKNGINVSVGAEIDLGGVGAGASQTLEAGKVNIHAFEGVKWSWDSVLPTVGGGIGFSWNTQKDMDEKLKEARGKTDLTKVWDKWKETPTSDVNTRYALLKDTPEVWKKVGPLVEMGYINEQDAVHMIELIEESLHSNVLEKLDASPVPLLSYVGIGFAGPIPIPHIGIKLGSAKIFIPNRREIAKMKDQISDIVISQKIDAALASLETTKITNFVEQTPQLVYSRDGQLMVLTNEAKVDFAALEGWETSLNTYNTALKEAEVSLSEVSKGKYELQVHNTNDKDVEVHIDPALEQLGIVEENGKIYLAGNIRDLIITRERFALPFKGEVGMSSMRDVITIRTTQTVEGGRDRNWIESNEKKFLQKLEKRRRFQIQNGAGIDSDTNNVLTATETAEVEKLLTNGQEFEKYLDNNELKALEGQINNRFKSLNSMPKTAYDKLPQRDNLYENLGKLWKNKQFQNELRRNMDRPDLMAKTISKYSEQTEGLKQLNEKELNTAVIYYLNEHFTTLATGETPNKTIKARLEKRIKFIKDRVLIPAFQETMRKLEPELNTEENKMWATKMAEKLTNDSFGGLLKKLNDSKFDYKTLKVEEIPQGAILLSGTRNLLNGKEFEGALGETVNYETTPKAKALLHDLGLLQGTAGEYKLNSTDKDEALLARIILEIASPTPSEDAEGLAGDIEFLKTPLALKVAGLGVHSLLAQIPEYAGYEELSEVYQNNNKIRESSKHKKAVDNFRKLVFDIRQAQLQGVPFIKEIPGTGLTVRIDMTNKIVHGAYSKCGNTTFYLDELGKVTVLKENKIVGVYNESHEVIDVTQSKMFASLGLGVGFKADKVTTSAPRKPRKTIEDQPNKPHDVVTPEGTGHTTLDEAGQGAPEIPN